MAAKPLDRAIADEIVTDWRVGQLSQQSIAEKHKVSKGVVNKLCKGVDRDVLPLNRVDCSITPIPSTVYIITANEYDGIFKIGITNDTARRLRDMQTGCPFVLFALRSYSVTNPVAVEAMLHAFFYKKRMCGEWFRLDSVDLKYIDDAMCVVDEVVDGKH